MSNFCGAIVLVILADAEVSHPRSVGEEVPAVIYPVMTNDPVPVAVLPDLNPGRHGDVAAGKALEAGDVDIVVLQIIATGSSKEADTITTADSTS
jgi:hypothetical protein